MAKKNAKIDENVMAEKNVDVMVNPDKEAKKAERKAKTQEARAILRNFAKMTDNEEVKESIFLLFGTGSRAPRMATKSINVALLEAIIEAGDQGLSEMDIFMKFKIGRPEMVSKCRIFVKTQNPEDRVWVKFHEDEEIYRVAGYGKNPPEGWDAFVPADEELL